MTITILNKNSDFYRSMKKMPFKIKWSFFIFFFLMFFDRIPVMLGINLGLVGSYIYLFAIFFTVLLLFVLKNSSLNLWLVISSLFVVFSALIGLMYGWYTKDILADVSRFIAPFIGFALGICLFRSWNLREIYSIFQLQIFYSLFIFFQSVWTKFNLVQNGVEPLIRYGGHGFGSDPLVLSVLLFLAASKRLNFFSLVLTGIYFLGGWISPILTQSKAGVLGIASLTLLFFLIGFSFPKKILVVFLLFLIGLCSMPFIQNYSSKNKVIRFEEFYKTVISGDFISGKDKSTTTRIIEIKTAIDDQLNEGVSGMIFGLGSGALWFPKSANMERLLLGLSLANFRENGGVHHIHAVPVAVLFRYGLIGFFIYGLWLLDILLRLGGGDSLPKEAIALKSAFRCFILVCIALSFSITIIYSTLGFGLILGMLVHINAKLPKKLTQNTVIGRETDSFKNMPPLGI